MSEGEEILKSDDEEYDPTDIFDDEHDKASSESDEPKFTESEKIQSRQKQDRQIEIKNKIPDGITLFLGLEDKTEEALTTFTNIKQTTYANKSLGDSRQNGEFMRCECFEDFEDGINSACLDDDCINRGTKIECINGHASCGENCANQRFQKKQYANINVIQTEKKGYGVRTMEELEPDTFIYEYIGEVIDEKTFKKRMIDYDQEGIKHFYFMMLQKGEFIDATKKGSLGRFLNHSCNPNCYVEKWVVGDKLRMGIFSKRKIIEGEELTFNYNVDRYGATAQQCFCGERNCIGFIGGKTQTDAASLLPQIISEALGSSVELEQEFLLLKKQRNEKVVKNDNNINVEYVNSLVMNPVEIFEINKVLGVLFQCDDSLIADKLIKRIELTDGAAYQKKLSSLHGLKALLRLIQHFYEKPEDNKNQLNVSEELILRILNVFLNWEPTKSSVDKTDAIAILENLKSHTQNTDIISIADRLTTNWSKLEAYQSIKKSDNPHKGTFFQYDHRRQRRDDTKSQRDSPSKDSPISQTASMVSMHTISTGPASQQNGLPYGWRSAVDPNTDREYFYHKDRPQETQWEKPGEETREDRERYRLERARREREEFQRQRDLELQKNKKKQELTIQQIVQKANEEALRKKKEEEARKEEEEKEKERKRKKKELYKAKMIARKENKNGGSTSETTLKASHIEAEWKKLFSTYVPNLLKKYVEEIGKDKVKNCARDVIHILVEKELKKDLKRQPPSGFKKEKREKIKEFTDNYMQKYLIKYRTKREGTKRSSEISNGPNKKQHI